MVDVMGITGIKPIRDRSNRERRQKKNNPEKPFSLNPDDNVKGDVERFLKRRKKKQPEQGKESGGIDIMA